MNKMVMMYWICLLQRNWNLYPAKDNLKDINYYKDKEIQKLSDCERIIQTAKKKKKMDQKWHQNSSIQIRLLPIEVRYQELWQ